MLHPTSRQVTDQVPSFASAHLASVNEGPAVMIGAATTSETKYASVGSARVVVGSRILGGKVRTRGRGEGLGGGGGGGRRGACSTEGSRVDVASR